LFRGIRACVPAKSGETPLLPTPTCERLPPGFSYSSEAGFGSAHAIGLNMAFCDGSVQTINYTIDNRAYGHLLNRQDGMVIDGKKL
jgi:prepilin-type processing-associated H-X9-DG protein